jgi:hypothetical protein
MKGYSDRQRQRDEARRRANRSERVFREREDARRMNLLRERININRLTSEITHSEGESRSKRLQDLYEEWDVRVKSALDRIKDSGLNEATKDRWSDYLKDLLVFSPNAKVRLEALMEEVQAFKPTQTPKYTLGETLDAPPRATSIWFYKVAEPPTQENPTLLRADLKLIDLAVTRLLGMYADYQHM